MAAGVLVKVRVIYRLLQASVRGALQQLAGQKRQLPQINALAYLQQLLYIFCFLSCGTDSAYTILTLTGCQAPVLRTVQDASVLLVTAQLVNS